MPNRPAHLKHEIVAIRRAVDALEELMLTDVWDALPPARQQELARAAQEMTRGANVLEAVRQATVGADTVFWHGHI